MGLTLSELCVFFSAATVYKHPFVAQSSPAAEGSGQQCAMQQWSGVLNSLWVLLFESPLQTPAPGLKA